MITQVLRCSYCQGTAIVKHGTTPEGKQRDRCLACSDHGRTFLLEVAYAGPSPVVKQQIVDMAMTASGIHDTARVLQPYYSYCTESSSRRCNGSCTWCDHAHPSVDLRAPHTPVRHLSETGERRRGFPAPTTRVLPRRRSGRLWASLPSAEYGTTARPTLGADGRFPEETGLCPPGPGPCRLCPSPTSCAGSPNTSGWRS